MKDASTALKKIYSEDKLILVMIGVNLFLSIILLIVGITSLAPESAVVKVGYGDIGGYRNGPWTEMLAFPLLAVALGPLHSVIALKIYNHRGAAITKFFLLVTTVVIAGTFVVLSRLTGGF